MKISFPLLTEIVARIRQAVRFQKEAALLPGSNPVFGFDVVTECPTVPSEILIPRNAWADKTAYDAGASAEVKAAAPTG